MYVFTTSASLSILFVFLMIQRNSSSVGPVHFLINYQFRVTLTVHIQRGEMI